MKLLNTGSEKPKIKKTHYIYQPKSASCIVPHAKLSKYT